MSVTAASSPQQAGCLVDPGRPLTFTFDGRSIAALSGQSIAAALYASGVRVFTRSFKYHRPRGLFCVAGDCPNCLMQVDGRPNVRTCIEPARQGQVVRHQNAWPSLGFDALRVFDKLDRFLPVGFYYKRFHKPRWLWPIFEHSVRHIAGLGRVDVSAVPNSDAEVEYLHTEVCVVGGGPAGIVAAAAAATAGARVLLLDRQPQPGGHLLFSGAGAAEIEPHLAALRASSRAQVLSDTSAFGVYEGNMLAAFQGNRLLKVRARHIVVCTGSRERPFVFHNNDLPGIILARGVQRLARLHGVRAGQRAVVLTDRDDGIGVAEDLSRLGIAVAAVIDPRPARPGSAGAKSASPLGSAIVLGAVGNARLRGVRVAELDARGVIKGGSEQQIDCDLLCVASTPVPANELLLQAGVRFQQNDGLWEMTRTVPGVSAAGGAAGTFDLAGQILEGRRCGLAAAASLGYAVSPVDHRAETRPAPRPGCCPSVFAGQAGDRKRFICLCEDVTEKDVEQAIAEGFDGMETLKRYSTVTMGPCQGKVCQQAAIEVCARAMNRTVAATGTTTSRPPAAPVELSVLAAGRNHPVRRTPLHHWHEAAGAQWLDAGLWKRPESYGDPAAEVRIVRTGVGLIDVSTLGKIEVVGPDAAELLERTYLNKWADLKPGRARYGVMCNEDGILFDDGVGARLGPDQFYLTATTGNAEGVVQWLELWKSTWRLNATLIDRTSAVAAMNLAGPRSREVLRGLTQLDISPAGFPYLALREADVAGIPCRLLRIGFVGELGYEIHCPAAYASHVWDGLYQAGKPFGLKPFGVEAQRILRLEKGHLIIGQDTDALSNPLEAGLEWLVRFDKPVFHGRSPLLRLKEMGARSRLVGFHVLPQGGAANAQAPVPSEGCQVVEQGRPVGRVTSSRYSPTLQRSLGLAWVPAARSSAGERFAVRWNGSDVAAEVVNLPFYDPEGKQLRA